MTKRLYMMRHGQTLFNIHHMIQGWCDAPLTKLGINQAKVAGQYFKDHHITFDHAYSSTSERACDTLEIVTEGKMPYTRVKGLKEWNFGKFEGQSETLNPPFPYGDFFVMFDGEGEKEFQERYYHAVKSIMDQDHHDSVLIVSHGAALGAFARRWDDYAVVHHRPGVGNCAIYVYDYDGETFILQDIIQHDFSHLI